MFYGTYQHSLDEKGRVVLPAKYRRSLEEGCVLTKGKDGCIDLFPAERWAEEVREILGGDRSSPESRQRRRAVFREAQDVTPDRQGRVPISPELREYADLGGDVVLVGIGDIVEIWNAARWVEVANRADASYVGE